MGMDTKTRLNDVAEILRTNFPGIDLTVEGPSIRIKHALSYRRRGHEENIPLQEHIPGQKQYIDLMAAVTGPIEAFCRKSGENIDLEIWTHEPDGKVVTIELKPNHYTLQNHTPEQLAEILAPVCEACRHSSAAAAESRSSRRSDPAASRGRN